MKENLEYIIQNFEGTISGVKEFQNNAVKCLAKKFYCEKKQKLVLADEVGMGKTYVCRGLIELGAQIKEKKSYTVIYIAPNEYISKQNLSELSDGFVTAKKNENKRMSELGKDVLNKMQAEKYNILSFSASMFFNTDEATVGTMEERLQICRYITSAFHSLYIKYVVSDEMQKRELEKKWNWVEMLFSAMANASLQGQNSRYYYYYDNKADEGTLRSFAKKYESFRESCLCTEKMDCNEAQMVYELLCEICDLENEQYMSSINQIMEHICGKDGQIEKIVMSRYTLPENRPKLPECLGQVEDKLQQDILSLLIPYYKNDMEEYYRTPLNRLFCEIREVANRANYKKLAPDFIILDEFHKYFSEDVRQRLDMYLSMVPDCKVILVSATPYKMHLKAVSMLSEDFVDSELEEEDEASLHRRKKRDSRELETCFGGYADLYFYLSGDKDEADKIAQNFEQIVDNLKQLQQVKSLEGFRKRWENCKEGKDYIEKKLRQYLIRTERAALLRENNTEMVIFEESESLTEQEIQYECEMVRSMFQDGISMNQALFYTKMSPYPLSFSKGYESLGYPEKDSCENEYLMKLRNYKTESFWDGKCMPKHFRLEKLLLATGWTEALKKALWMPPTESDKVQGFWKDIREFSKAVVFVRHIMTTKSVAGILSTQFEQLACREVMFEDDIFKVPQILEKEDYAGEEGTLMYYEPVRCFYRVLCNYCEKEEQVQKKANEYGRAMYAYLKEYKHVLYYAGVRNKESLLQYCKDGDLEGAIEEYIFLLTKGKKIKNDTVNADFWEKLDKIKEALDVEKRGMISYYKKNSSTNIVSEEYVRCSIAERYSEETLGEAKGANILEHVTVAFNSPFYPFYLVTTPIAQEGLNFQNYALKTFHWNSPVSPIDYEQREGRINRYRNYAVRKSLKKEFGKVPKDWKTLFEIAEQEAKKRGENFSGLNPDWVTKVQNNQKMFSYLMSHPGSREFRTQEVLIKAVNHYRVSLGYGISNNMVMRIRENANGLGADCNMEEILIQLLPE